jgi:hypothetical protein
MKRNEVKGSCIDKLGYIDLLDAITHVEIGKTITCVLHNISYDIPFHSIFRSVYFFIPSSGPFRISTNTQRLMSTYKLFHTCFFHFEGYCEHNYCNLLTSARS